MRLILAPMEGVLDYHMRDLLTRLSHFDRCVTEFVRVTQQALPAKVFYRYCPELHQNGHTAAGTPVYLQLLGSDPDSMAKNAQTAVKLGAPGVDLNFGCPSKTVNKNDGGSTLLKTPERIYPVVKAVRDIIPAPIPVTAKIRLGFDDSSLLEEIVAAIETAGATELCIHARTRKNGYKPPAYWQHIKRIQSSVTIPVITNGEIWSAADAKQAQKTSGFQDLMLGRGSLCCPDLANIIRADQNQTPYQALQWPAVAVILLQHFKALEQQHPRYAANRIKQWLNYLRRQYAQAEALFQNLKRLTQADAIRQQISQQTTHEGEPNHGKQ